MHMITGEPSGARLDVRPCGVGSMTRAERNAIADLIEDLIALLDADDGDIDAEPEPLEDAEPIEDWLQPARLDGPAPASSLWRRSPVVRAAPALRRRADDPRNDRLC